MDCFNKSTNHNFASANPFPSCPLRHFWKDRIVVKTLIEVVIVSIKIYMCPRILGFLLQLICLVLVTLIGIFEGFGVLRKGIYHAFLCFPVWKLLAEFRTSRGFMPTSFISQYKLITLLKHTQRSEHVLCHQSTMSNTPSWHHICCAFF